MDLGRLSQAGKGLGKVGILPNCSDETGTPSPWHLVLPAGKCLAFAQNCKFETKYDSTTVQLLETKNPRWLGVTGLRTYKNL